MATKQDEFQQSFKCLKAKKLGQKGSWLMLMRWIPVSKYIWGEFSYFLSKQDNIQQSFNRCKLLKRGQKNENLV